MIIFPAIDLLGGKAVRLFKGDYDKVTIYSERPEEVALDFKDKGASHIHIVDLDGAKSGLSPNFDTVKKIKETSGLFCEIGGGVRSMDTVRAYIEAGLDRVILGTAAVEDEAFLRKAAKLYGDKIAVGADIKDGYIALRGWTQLSSLSFESFFERMSELGIGAIICTDISRDGAMRGTNLSLYKQLSSRYNMNIVASGGVSSMEDVKKLREMELYGAIIGKAYYTGSIDLREAVEIAR